jgi:PAS domain S-box-containing protein
MGKGKKSDELIIANEELAFQNKEKEKRAAELIIANKELAFQNEEKEKRAAELIIANKELAFQNEEKEKRAAELIIANKELAHQNKVKEKRASELIVANVELALQNKVKEKRAAELIIANKELAFQNTEKEKRAAELIIANKELAFQNKEKEKRAAELIIANKELAFQNKEKEKRAAELIIANKELAFQNIEKEKRAAELIIANKELAFQNKEKEKRAAELIIANKELIFQNKEKEKRAAELFLLNKELADYKYALDQSSIVAITDPKEIIKHVNDNFFKISKYSREELIGHDKRIVNPKLHPKEYILSLWTTVADGKVWRGELKNKAKDGTIYWVDTTIIPFLDHEEKPYQYAAIQFDITELKKTEQKLKEQLVLLKYQNKQLNDFNYIISHNLRGPLVSIAMLVDYIENSKDEAEQKELFKKIKPVLNNISETFDELVESLQVKYDLKIKSDKIIVKESIKKTLSILGYEISSSEAVIDIDINEAPVIHFPAKYLNSILFNLISNSLKYKSPDRKPIIEIKTKKIKDRILLSVTDNGLGIDLNMHKNNLFKIRKVFHKHPDAKGFGLFMTKTQVEAMGGKIWAESKPKMGSTFFVEFINQNT